MKGQARNIWRGTRTTRERFCSLFSVEHSLRTNYAILIGTVSHKLFKKALQHNALSEHLQDLLKIIIIYIYIYNFTEVQVSRVIIVVITDAPLRNTFYSKNECIYIYIYMTVLQFIFLVMWKLEYLGKSHGNHLSQRT